MKYLFKHLHHLSHLKYLLLAAILTPAYASHTISPILKTEAKGSYGQMPLSFETNQGQTDSQVKFLSRGHGYTLYLTATEAVLSLQKLNAKSDSVTTKAIKMDNTALHMQWRGGNSTPQVTGQKDLQGKVNYLVGREPSHWHTGINTYAQVAYKDIYPGIDLVYYGNQGQLEYDVIVAPKADPKSIRLAFQGTDKIKVNDHGELLLNSGNQEIHMHKPIIYQEIDGIRKTITGGYTLSSANEVGFTVGKYDRSHPLVIDPVLVYSTFLGGSGSDNGESITLDSSAHVYVTGNTTSLDFPTTLGTIKTIYQEDPNGCCQGDIFVTKLSPDGSSLIFSTYLGGTNGDVVNSIALDTAGQTHITGYTYSTDFPITPRAAQNVFGGNFYDGFVAKLNKDGSGFIFSSYLGGNGLDGGRCITLDSVGQIYVTGFTDGNFPTTQGAFQTSKNGSVDAFVTKLTADGTRLIYSTYLGGRGADHGLAITVNTNGQAYIAGISDQYPDGSFPTTQGAFQTEYTGNPNGPKANRDGFITRLNADGSGLIYSTLFGSHGGDDVIHAITVDALNQAYITGETVSPAIDFPITFGAFQTSIQSESASFLTKLNSNGSEIIYSTYLGGNDISAVTEVGTGIKVNTIGQIFITGHTGSKNFPTTTNAIQKTYGGGETDAFITQFNTDGSPLYSSYIGGDGNDNSSDIIIDNSNNVYLIGTTSSSNFPITTSAFQNSLAGSYDTFITKLNLSNQPIDKEQCKKNGWKIFSNPSFKNQGECETFVKNHRRNDD